MSNQEKILRLPAHIITPDAKIDAHETIVWHQVLDFLHHRDHAEKQHRSSYTPKILALLSTLHIVQNMAEVQGKYSLAEHTLLVTFYLLQNRNTTSTEIIAGFFHDLGKLLLLYNPEHPAISAELFNQHYAQFFHHDRSAVIDFLIQHHHMIADLAMGIISEQQALLTLFKAPKDFELYQLMRLVIADVYSRTSQRKYIPQAQEVFEKLKQRHAAVQTIL